MDGNSSSDDFVAGIAVFGIFVMPVLGWVLVRYLKHVEYIAMIRAGMQPPIKGSGRDWRNAVPPPGMSVPPPQYSGPIGRKNRQDHDFSAIGQQIALQRGIRLSFIGLALTIGLSFIGFHHDSWEPGPWLLGGLIPLFIGLAQVSSAVIGGASFGPMFNQPQQPGAPYVEPPFNPGPPPPFGAPPTYDSSYTYRPGDTTELRPPPMPPDRR